jgi:hypothetical protein
MDALSPPRVTGDIERPRTAPPRTGSGGILRTSSSSDCAAGESPTNSPRSVPSNISFAPLPEIGPRKRRSNRPLGVAARSIILHRQRSNLKHSDPTTETDYQYPQQPSSLGTPGDAPHLWPGMDDPQYALQVAMAGGGPEPSNTECPTIVYVENGEPQLYEEPQVMISVSTPKRNRSRKGANHSKHSSDRGAEEGALHELRKMATKDKDANDGSGLKFWRRLGKRSSTSALPRVKLPVDQMLESPSTTAAVPTAGNMLVGHRSGKQTDDTNPLPFERRSPPTLAEFSSPSIVISPVAQEPSEPELTFNQSDTSTASTIASSCPPTPEMRSQNPSPVEISGSCDIFPTPRPRPSAANDTEDDGVMDAPLPGLQLVEIKRHSDEPYSHYERVPVSLASTASL